MTPFPITGPLRPATSMEPAGLPGVEPGPTRLELVVLPLHHRPTKRTTRIERASPEWQKQAVTRRSQATSQSASQATPTDALPTELRPRDTPRLESNQRA